MGARSVRQTTNLPRWNPPSPSNSSDTIRTGRTMRPRFLRFTSISILLALLLALIPATVFAQTTIASVTPLQVVNNVENTITVSGAGFDNSAVVQLGGNALSTTFGNAQTLTAIVPEGFA